MKEKRYLKQTKSISVPESPSSRHIACRGAVRNMVNRLAFEICEEQPDAIGGEQLGERSIETDSPFPAPAMTCTFQLIAF